MGNWIIWNTPEKLAKSTLCREKDLPVPGLMLQMTTKVRTDPIWNEEPVASSSVSHVDVESQGIGPSFIAFPGYQHGAWWAETPNWCLCGLLCRQRISYLSYYVGPIFFTTNTKCNLFWMSKPLPHQSCNCFLPPCSRFCSISLSKIPLWTFKLLFHY